jgi:photosystem II stability/assembly factor-like uncharacterized protein
MFGRALRLAAVLFVLAPAAASRAASIWTPVATGTTQTITAIAAPSNSKIVIATTSGSIRYSTGGAFAAATVTPSNPSGFTDIAMSPDGTKGVAVGPSGTIYASSDSGVSWTKDAVPSDFMMGCPAPGGATPLSTDLTSVQFADATTVYASGNNDVVLKSTNGGTTFSEVNKTATTCVANPGGPFTDTAWIDANHGFLLSNDFGSFWSTADGFMTATHKGDAVNGFTGVDRLALDPTDPQKLWAINIGGMNSSYFQASTDGGNTWSSPMYDNNQTSFQDIATAGGTVVVAGLSGDIYTSKDGRNFNRQLADTPNTTNDWHAVTVLDATHAFVGGANGVLLSTSAANTVPDNDTAPPVGSIAGPTQLAVGQQGTYVATAADEPGGQGIDPGSFVWTTAGQSSQTGATATFAFSTTGAHVITATFKDLSGNQGSATITVQVTGSQSSGQSSGSNPTSTHIGGATIVIFKRVTVTGRSSRFIPVTLSTGKQPRRFVVSLLTVKTKKNKKTKTLATLTTTLRKSLSKTVRLGVPNSVKAGSYQLVVQVFTTGGHSRQVGRSVKQVFVLV